MNYPQRKQTEGYAGTTAADVAYGQPRGLQATPVNTESHHAIIGRVLERLYQLAQQTDRIVTSVGAGVSEINEKMGASDQPHLTDKLYSAHQLIARIESNVNAIESTIG